MPGIEGSECKDLDERRTGAINYDPGFPSGERRYALRSIEVRTTEIEAAFRAFQLASAFNQRG